jgi:hypothetical protein
MIERQTHFGYTKPGTTLYPSNDRNQEWSGLLTELPFRLGIARELF